MPTLDRRGTPRPTGLRRGAYVLADGRGGPPELILIATGSEVAPGRRARERLPGAGRARARASRCRLGAVRRAAGGVPRRGAAAGASARAWPSRPASPLGWDSYVGPAGAVIGVDRFGASAPGKVVMEKYGFTVENVAEKAVAVKEAVAARLGAWA